MKHIRYFVFSALMLFVTVSAWAYDFVVDGIYYSVINNMEVEVARSLYYSGVISIPQTVNFDGVSYSVTSIGDFAFAGCKGLTSIVVPNTVISIGNDAFSRCTGLEQITVDSENTIYDSRNYCNAIIKTSTNELIFGCKSTLIPNSVTSIRRLAFNGHTGLTSIIIPNSVLNIGRFAFQDCTGLTSITIPASVASIGTYAFDRCSSLEQITVNFGNAVYDSRNNCNAIIEKSTNTLVFGCMNTVIPNSVTSIGVSAFNGHTGLTSIAIPNSVTSLGSEAFSGCTGLTSIAIPNSVTSLGSKAFSGCTGLTSIAIPNSMTFIGSGAFDETGIYNDESNWENEILYIDNCLIQTGKNVFSIEIKQSTRLIAENAFSNSINTGLNSIVCRAITPPTVCSHYGFFGSAYSQISLFVPCGIENAYANADGWKEFGSINGANFFVNYEARSSNEELGCVFVVQHPDCENGSATLQAVPKDGCAFRNWTINGQVISTCNPYTLVVEDGMVIVANFSGVGVDEDVENRITISPNPAKDFVNIECENMKGITLFTMDGRVSKTYKLNVDAFILDMTGLSQGIYILRIETNAGAVINRKIIKE